MLAKMKAAADATVSKIEQKVDEKLLAPKMGLAKPSATPPASPIASRSNSAASQPSDKAAPAASAASVAAAAKAFEHVPKDELVTLLAKTSGRCKQLEMRLAEMKGLHVALLEEKRELVASRGKSGGAMNESERESLEAMLRQTYEDKMGELEEQLQASGGINRTLQADLSTLTAELQAAKAALAASEEAARQEAARAAARPPADETLEWADASPEQRARLEALAATLYDERARAEARAAEQVRQSATLKRAPSQVS